MFSVEENEINDRDIMTATKIFEDAHGRIQFKTTLPSGRDLNSEWVQASDKSKAGILWAEAVRGQIIADSQEASAKARKDLKERRAAAPPVPKLVDVDGSPLKSGAPSTSQTSINTVGAAQSYSTPAIQNAPAVASPDTYVKSQYLQAKAMAAFAKATLLQAQRDFKEAQQAEAKWFGLVQAMGIDTSERQEKLNSIHPSVTSSSGGNPVIVQSVSTNLTDAVADQDDDESWAAVNVSIDTGPRSA